MNFTFTGGAGLMDRVTAPDPVGGAQGREEAAAEFAFWQTGYSDKYHDWLDDHIGVNSALSISTAWACIRWISQTIASLGWHVYERKDKSREQIGLDDTTAWVLDMQTNSEVSAFDWKQAMMNHALTDGNGYSEIERDGFGRLQWCWQLGRGRCAPDRTESGKLIYEVTNGSGVKNQILDPSQVFHLKGPSEDGIVGYSMISIARRALGIALHEEKFGDDFFSRGPTPGGIFTTPTKLTEQAEKQARESFDKLYSGRKNVGRVIRLTGAATFTPLSLPNTDAQFLESRRFSVEEICRFYGVPPHKVQHLERSTFNNIEHQAIEAVQDCLMPWARRLESEADIKFFGRVLRGRRYTRLNLATLLRGDTASQTEALQKQVNAALRTPNEARELLDLNPDPDGDVLLIQGAMVPLERALAEGEKGISPTDTALALQRLYLSVNSPQPLLSADEARGIANRAGAGLTGPAPEERKPTQQTTAPADDEPEEPDDDSADDSADPAKVAAVFAPIFADAYRKLLGFEADKAKQAARKGKFVSYLAKQYGPESQAHVAAALQPIFAAFLLAAKRSGDPKALAAAAAERHVEFSKQVLAAAGKVPDDFYDRGPEIAAELKIAWESTT